MNMRITVFSDVRIGQTFQFDHGANQKCFRKTGERSYQTEAGSTYTIGSAQTFIAAVDCPFQAQP